MKKKGMLLNFIKSKKGAYFLVFLLYDKKFYFDINTTWIEVSETDFEAYKEDYDPVNPIYELEIIDIRSNHPVYALVSTPTMGEDYRSLVE